TESRELIPELCRQFGLVTGWPMHFTPLDRPPAEIREELENRPECCWFAEITDGTRPAGFLHLESADDASAAGNFVEATTLAEALGRVLGRLAQAMAQLQQRNKDVA